MSGLQISLPIAMPPWTALGRHLESLCRKALYTFSLVENVNKLGIALSGGKDSLAMLYLLKAISGRGFPPFSLHAFHVTGEFSCGSSVNVHFLQAICKQLDIPLTLCESTQKRESLQCYSCSRERRKLLFEAAKKHDITTISFGHHRDDSIQTLLMNLFHKGEFAANLPKVPMHDYGVTIIRPLIYVAEKELIAFAKLYQFHRITCQCPVGQDSMRKQTEHLIAHIEELFPNIRENLSLASFVYASDKALYKKKPSLKKSATIETV
ncbi:MAG: tRNA 2-thiocytidine biosynthesis protein TtcA [Chlamydiae bacterium]|nr:tRNA 2-thiocytidine biosynthesis protein TtcA [Chlamydiota bacterium]